MMNILIYVLDSLRPDHLSCYGYERQTSPHMDALASDGICFDRAYAQSTWTRPSAGTLLTGLYPVVHGASSMTAALRAQVPYLPARQLYMREYVVPRPFSDEVHGKLARHEGVKDIGGVACDVVYVLYKTGVDARWYFGQEDHLPRGVERLSPEGNTILLLSNLDTDPEIGDTTFRPTCPQGYQEDKRVLIEVDPETLQDYVGNYRINEETTREVMIEGGRIFTQRSGFPRLEIFPVAKDRFFYADSFVNLTFFRDEQGRITHQVLDRLFGDRETAVKTDQPAPAKTTVGP